MLDHPMIVSIWGQLERDHWKTGDLSEMAQVRMYLGEEDFNARKVMRRTLYASRCSTGNQWRLLGTGVMCEYFRVFVTRRAAAFWTRWSF